MSASEVGVDAFVALSAYLYIELDPLNQSCTGGLFQLSRPGHVPPIYFNIKRLCVTPACLQASKSKDNESSLEPWAGASRWRGLP